MSASSRLCRMLAFCILSSGILALYQSAKAPGQPTVGSDPAVAPAADPTEPGDVAESPHVEVAFLFSPAELGCQFSLPAGTEEASSEADGAWLGYCKGIDFDAGAVEWHAAPGGQVRLLDSETADMVAAALLSSDVTMAGDGRFVVYVPMVVSPDVVEADQEAEVAADEGPVGLQVCFVDDILGLSANAIVQARGLNTADADQPARIGVCYGLDVDLPTEQWSQLPVGRVIRLDAAESDWMLESLRAANVTVPDDALLVVYQPPAPAESVVEPSEEASEPPPSGQDSPLAETPQTSEVESPQPPNIQVTFLTEDLFEPEAWSTLAGVLELAGEGREGAQLAVCQGVELPTGGQWYEIPGGTVTKLDSATQEMLRAALQDAGLALLPDGVFVLYLIAESESAPNTETGPEEGSPEGGDVSEELATAEAPADSEDAEGAMSSTAIGGDQAGATPEMQVMEPVEDGAAGSDAPADVAEQTVDAGGLPDPEAPTSPDVLAAASELGHLYPGVSFSAQAGRITAAYGTAFGQGASPQDCADQFMLQHAALFGIEADDLVWGNHFNDVVSQPLGYDSETGLYRFTLVYLAQYRDGVPVFRAGLRLLIRNEASYPLVLATSTLRDLGDFRVPSTGLRSDADAIVSAAALAAVPDFVNIEPWQYVVWAGVEDTAAAPRLAIQVIADNGPDAWEPARWLLVVDALSGEELYRENLIVFTDVTGNVSGMATTGNTADNCANEPTTPMRYATVNIQGGNSAWTDASGNFTITNSGSTPVTVVSGMSGHWFTVDNIAGAEETLTTAVTPPGPANFSHNGANNSEQVRAQVNAYVQANTVRDFILAQNPSYPTIATQTGFLVNVNSNGGLCPGNAWYSGTTINFCLAGSGFANTAYSSWVHHEYGHHAVAMGGSGQSEYGEGMGDCIAILISNDPVLFYGYAGNCASGERTANNTCQYQTTGCSSCGSEVHDCGRLLAGCVWSTRTELLAVYPSTYLGIIRNLTVDSIPLHDGTAITPLITLQFLTLDDIGGNLNDGTPHYTEIAKGFGAHSMLAPPVNVAATDGTSCTYARVTWNTVPYATAYSIWRHTSNNSGSATQIGTTTSTQYDDTTGTPGTTYYYWARATKTGGINSEFSPSDSGYRILALAPPTGVAASDGTYCGYVRITWTASSGATGYKVYRGTSNTACSSLLGTTSSTTYDDTSATAGTTYYYSVKATSSCGDSPCSSTNSGYRGVTTSAPTGVNASDGAYCDKVVVTWNTVTGATSYKVYRSTSNTGCSGSPIGTSTGTTYDDTTAACGTTYYYSVTASNACGDSPCSSTNSGYRGTPAAPTNVAATDGTYCDKVRVTWNSVTCATSYKVYRSTSNTACSGSPIATVSGPTYDDTSAAPGTTYYYSVKATSSCGDSPCSSTNSGYRGVATSAPTGVSATDGTYCDKVVVTWNAVAGATSYKIYRSTSNTQCPGSPIGTATGTTYDDTTAACGTTYYYSMTASNACGDSPCSSTNSGYRGTPAAPTNVAATDGTYCDKVWVTWSAVTCASSYKVYRSTSNTACSGSPIATVSGTTYDDTSATPGTTYYYSVKATSSCGDSPCSSTNSGYRGVATSAPTGVNASDGAYCDKVVVTWNAVTGATSYKVYRSTSNTGCSGSPIGTTTGTSYDDTMAACANGSATTYYYSVKASNTCGDSPCSSTNSGYRGTPGAPTGVSATDGAYCDKVRVTWNSVTCATSYKVYRSTSNTACSGSPIATVSGTTYDDTSATPGTTYYYSVKATSSCGDSPCSSTNSGYRGVATSAPTGVSASDGTYCDKVVVTWNAVTGATSYKVYRSTSNTGCSGSPIGTTTGMSYDDTMAACANGSATTYYYSVKASNTCGDSPCSSTNSGYRGTPAAPTGVTATDDTYCDKVRVTWNSVTCATSYKVYRSTSNAACSGSPIATVSGTAYDDTSATAGTTYYYSVRATSSCGDSPCSNVDSGRRGMAPAVPTNVSATDGTYSDKVVVTWSAVSGATTYKVYRSTSNTGCSGSPIGTSTTTTYNDTTATPGTTYYYSVKASNACGDSPCSATNSGYRSSIVTLTVNGAVVTGNISPAGDADWYQFSASTSATYTIETWAGTLSDNYMSLYGPNSQTAWLEDDDDDGNGNAAKIVRTLSPGTYYVKIRAYYSSTATGTYTIQVRR